MALDEFQCVVLGDEPAGLWILRRLRELAPEARLGWVSYEQIPPPVCVPVSLARPFRLKELGPSWSAEIVTPSRTLPWSAEALRAAFPELPPISTTAR